MDRSVAQSVDVTPKRSKERGGWSQRLQGQSPEKRVRDSRDRVGQPKAVGRVKASGNLYTKSSRPGLSSEDRTSEGFWKSSRTGLSHPAMRDK